MTVAEAFALRGPEQAWIGGAEFSPCHQYRLSLWRQDPMVAVVDAWLLWVMLNPSKAGAPPDGDPTITKCIGFAKRWGYHGFRVVNLYQWIQTHPQHVFWVADPLGPYCDFKILAEAKRAARIVCAWGSQPNPKLKVRAAAVTKMLLDGGFELSCLGLTRTGQPKHPGRLGYDTPLEPYRGAA